MELGTSPGRRIISAVTTLVVLAIPSVLLYSSLKGQGYFNSLDKALIRITAPLQHVFTSVTGSVSDVWTHYLALVNLKEENESLKGEVASLKGQLQQMNALMGENARLRKLLAFGNSTHGLRLLAARVISRNVSPFFRVVRIEIDRGDDQVKPGMPVIATEGVVGQIHKVYGDYSDVLLAVDRQSSIDVIIQNSRTRGILRGLGEKDSYKCTLAYLMRQDSVAEGDVVVTSGMGFRFPRDLMIGTVTTVTSAEQDLFREALIEPAVDFSRLEEVFVVLQTFQKPLDGESLAEAL